MARVLLEVAALDALDDVDEALVGAGRDADLLAFAHEKQSKSCDGYRWTPRMTLPALSFTWRGVS